MIVVDTNVIGFLYLNSERLNQAEQAFKKDPYWAAPVLWRSEFQNVLAFYMRRQILSLNDAQGIRSAAVELMSGREYEVPFHSVLNLASRSPCSAYDCEFIALALDLQVPLVTVDQQILTHFSKAAIALDRFTGVA